MKSELYLFACLQVDSPMNLKHPHDLVILMRQETTVNYLKELEVRQLDKQHTADTWCISQELEKAMATHSSPLAWKIPWTEEPGRLQSMGWWRVGHGWATSLSLFAFVHWRRKWQPTPVFLPGESLGQQSLVGCCLWGRTELDTTDAT